MEWTWLSSIQIQCTWSWSLPWWSQRPFLPCTGRFGSEMGLPKIAACRRKRRRRRRTRSCMWSRSRSRELGKKKLNQEKNLAEPSMLQSVYILIISYVKACVLRVRTKNLTCCKMQLRRNILKYQNIRSGRNVRDFLFGHILVPTRTIFQDKIIITEFRESIFSRIKSVEIQSVRKISVKKRHPLIEWTWYTKN